MVQHHITRENRFEIAIQRLSLALVAHLPYPTLTAHAQLPKCLRRDVGLADDAAPRRWFDFC